MRPRNTFEPGDEFAYDDQGNIVPDGHFREAFEIAPTLPDFINQVREQGRREGYELGQSEAFKKWKPKPSSSGETFYTPKELAEEWKLSEDFIRDVFRAEPDVLKFGRNGTRMRRQYKTLRIPLSVVERVRRRIGA